MSEELIIRGPKPFYDIPDVSVPELLMKLLSSLDEQSICCVSHSKFKSIFELTLNLIRKDRRKHRIKTFGQRIADKIKINSKGFD